MLTSLHRLTARPNRLICVYLHAVQLSLYSNRRSLLKKGSTVLLYVCVCLGRGGGSVVLFFAVPRSIPTSDAFFPPTVVCAPTCTASVTGLSHYTESTARVKKAHNPYSMSCSSAPL